MSTQSFYITTAIDYPNGEPHIGHRSRRSRPMSSRAITGCSATTPRSAWGWTRTASTSCAAAQEHGVSPQAWTDQMDETFTQAWNALESFRSMPGHGRLSRVTAGIGRAVRARADERRYLQERLCRLVLPELQQLLHRWRADRRALSRTTRRSRRSGSRRRTTSSRSASTTEILREHFGVESGVRDAVGLARRDDGADRIRA